jgi:hypothetical protein
MEEVERTANTILLRPGNASLRRSSNGQPAIDRPRVAGRT